MKKTCVYLDDESQARQLRLVNHLGTSQVEIVRRALAELEFRCSSPGRFQLFPVAAGMVARSRTSAMKNGGADEGVWQGLTILVDTSALVAAADRLDPWHPRVTTTMRTNAGRLVVPAPLLSEIDCMSAARLGLWRRGRSCVRNLASTRKCSP
jgi:hypothetical protein